MTAPTLSDAQLADAARRATNGTPLAEIADGYGISMAALRKQLRAVNYETDWRKRPRPRPWTLLRG